MGCFWRSCGIWCWLHIVPVLVIFMWLCLSETQLDFTFRLTFHLLEVVFYGTSILSCLKINVCSVGSYAVCNLFQIEKSNFSFLFIINWCWYVWFLLVYQFHLVFQRMRKTYLDYTNYFPCGIASTFLNEVFHLFWTSMYSILFLCSLFGLVEIDSLFRWWNIVSSFVVSCAQAKQPDYLSQWIFVFSISYISNKIFSNADKLTYEKGTYLRI